VLIRELLPKLDDQLKHELVYWAAFYEHRVQVGSKEIFHLEVCGWIGGGVYYVCVWVCISYI
jgi:hypothetical protein